ncbi:MAG: PEP-utilizing enzyme [Saprospiraceae bacterium]|nr:PEP-utilizing enzyme [Saprospiraceae bacterium]
MSKLSQLEWFRQLNLPTPAFQSVSYNTFKEGRLKMKDLSFPLAVRSTFDQEDGEQQSFAGNFHTALQVAPEQLDEAIQAVFDSYPDPKGQQVILQEMIQADYSGVLFAFRQNVWKLEMVPGAGEALVSGRLSPNQMLLPRFQAADLFWAKLYRFWQPVEAVFQTNQRVLMQLSVYAGQLLADTKTSYGLDIEFAIQNGRLFLLQARPITTPEEAEEVLTSANHKEILPPKPSRLMSSLIADSGKDLFQYYQDLDNSLITRDFIHQASGMPWINLSALLDIMVHWGLPTSLVCNSVGAEDFYRVGLRPYRMMYKLPVFLKVLRQQNSVQKAIKTWVEQQKKQIPVARKSRALLWQSQPAKAFELWKNDFQKIYVELVTHMQALTGAMSGGANLLQKLGWLQKISHQKQSKSTDYLFAFQAFLAGQISKTSFVEQYGHRGFYESDIGQKRFAEYSDTDWEALMPSNNLPKVQKKQQAKIGDQLVGFLFRKTRKLIHSREWIRHESMYFFQSFRQELIEAFEDRLIDPFGHPFPELQAYFEEIKSQEALNNQTYETQSGWDLNSFLCNQHGRRMAVPGIQSADQKIEQGIGIYPGKVKGQVWRVHEADFTKVKAPDYERLILVADALDPGWIPYFTKVEGVISYVGGLLSHASIILRESKIPAITQAPAEPQLETGDWIEMDGKTGQIKLLTRSGQDHQTP